MLKYHDQAMTGRNIPEKPALEGLEAKWDEIREANGLPTERRVQNYIGVRCDSSLPYDPGFQPPDKPDKDQILISQRNFGELCEQLTAADAARLSRRLARLGSKRRNPATHRSVRIMPTT